MEQGATKPAAETPCPVIRLTIRCDFFPRSAPSKPTGSDATSDDTIFDDTNVDA